MKKAIPFIFLLALTACKKDDPAPSGPGPTPTPATPGANYVVLNGDGHVDDTVRYDTLLTGYRCDTSAATLVKTNASSPSFSLCAYKTDTGFIFVDDNSQFLSSILTYIGSATYTYNTTNSGVTIHYTRYDAVGGLIEGEYYGQMRNSSTSAFVNITGKFSVVRGPDQ